MTFITLTPVSQNIFNEFDHQGILLGLPRLRDEKNSDYKRRLLDVMIRRGGSSYDGLVNSITRELGLTIQDVILIEPVLDTNDVPLLTYPAISFDETKCILYSNFITEEILLTIDRFEPQQGAYTLTDLVNVINATGYFTATLLTGVDGTKRSMTIFNQSTITLVNSEDISGGGVRIRLANTNLVPGTISIRSSNLFVRRSSSDNLQPGEYFIDEESGTIFSAQNPADGSTVRYKFRDDSYLVQSSPVIIHNLQSDDFKSKMFEVIDLETSQFGRPTNLGADLINELLSVYATNYGP